MGVKILIVDTIRLLIFKVKNKNKQIKKAKIHFKSTRDRYYIVTVQSRNLNFSVN